MVQDVEVHPTAVVAAEARVGRGTVIEPYAVVGPGVQLGEHCRVGSHVVITGRVRCGDRNRFFPTAVIGQTSQDLWDPAEEAWVVLGDDNVIREAATINTGTSKEYRCTSVGNRNNIMAGCHVAHDCVIGDDVVLANNVLLGGHVRIEDFASLGGGAALHHFVTVGRRAFVGGLTRVIHDVPPWLLMEGHPGRLKAVNVVGAHRHGLDEERISAIRHAFRRLYGPEGEGNRSGVLQQMLQEEGLTSEVQEMLAALERQASGRQGRYLEGFRLEDNTLDLEAIPSRYRPRFIP